MDIRLIAASVAEVETECLVIIALDHGALNSGTANNGAKQKSDPKLAVKDAALDKAVADLIASGEITGKSFEAILLHRPQGLKAARLLVIGAGKAKNFSSVELRKAAGTAVRYLKPKMIKSCAFVLPD